jgi:hypothetical protein
MNEYYYTYVQEPNGVRGIYSSYTNQQAAETEAVTIALRFKQQVIVTHHDVVVSVFNVRGKKLQFPIAQVIALVALKKSSYNEGFKDGYNTSALPKVAVSTGIPGFFGIHKQGELWMVGSNAGIFVNRGTQEHMDLCVAEREGCTISVNITMNP